MSVLFHSIYSNDHYVFIYIDRILPINLSIFPKNLSYTFVMLLHMCSSFGSSGCSSISSIWLDGILHPFPVLYGENFFNVFLIRNTRLQDFFIMLLYWFFYYSNLFRNINIALTYWTSPHITCTITVWCQQKTEK